jgi:DNA uptake protein ComE-like DNA-binding protein
MRIPPPSAAPASTRTGSTLVIVLWVSFGLVSLALYFGHANSIELRAADHRAAGIEAFQAISGAARYAAHIVTNLDTPGVISDLTIAPTYPYRAEAVPIGDSRFWFIGRDPDQLASGIASQQMPRFRLVDEASRLNLNTATAEMLELLPRMTPAIAAAIIDWRDADSDVSEMGAEDETYQRLNPPYRCKNAPFESIEELRLVTGITPEILYGEDLNRNGILDPNEDDLDLAEPLDNRDGRLDPGLVEFLTVHSRESTLRADGTPRISIGAQGRQELGTLLQERFGADRGNQILGALGNPNQPPSSLLEFQIRTSMSVDEFIQIENDIIADNPQQPSSGLVNVNSAPEAVLACIPGIGLDLAPALVAYRQSNPNRRDTVAWVGEVMESSRAIEAGRYLTGRSTVYAADVAAVGHFGRGYRRVRYVLDASEGILRIVQRQDLTHLGWALGRQVRQDLEQQQVISRTSR